MSDARLAAVCDYKNTTAGCHWPRCNCPRQVGGGSEQMEQRIAVLEARVAELERRTAPHINYVTGPSA